ncbi:hypothetical protein ACFL6Y_04445 [Elusimicrobiota bacterium]
MIDCDCEIVMPSCGSGGCGSGGKPKIKYCSIHEQAHQALWVLKMILEKSLLPQDKGYKEAQEVIASAESK